MVDGNEPTPGGRVGPELIGRLLGQLAPALTLYARQLCNVPEDIVQDAFIALAEQREAPGDPAAWLYRVVRNRALSAARTARRRRRHESAASARPDWFLPQADAAIDAASAADALARLPREQREVVVARIWGGLTFQEIGRLMGTSDSSAHRQYQTALRALQEQLRVPCPEKK